MWLQLTLWSRKASLGEHTRKESQIFISDLSQVHITSDTLDKLNNQYCATPYLNHPIKTFLIEPDKVMVHSCQYTTHSCFRTRTPSSHHTPAKPSPAVLTVFVLSLCQPSVQPVYQTWPQAGRTLRTVEQAEKCAPSIQSAGGLTNHLPTSVRIGWLRLLVWR